MFRKNKQLLSFLFFAALAFAVLTVGGDFLHGFVHHHDDARQYDECPVTHLLVQAVMFTAVLSCTASLSAVLWRPFAEVFIAAVPENYLPPLRAPPVLA